MSSWAEPNEAEPPILLVCEVHGRVGDTRSTSPELRLWGHIKVWRCQFCGTRLLAKADTDRDIDAALAMLSDPDGSRAKDVVTTDDLRVLFRLAVARVVAGE